MNNISLFFVTVAGNENMSVLLKAIIMSQEGMTVSTLRSFRELHHDHTAGTQIFWIVPSLPVAAISSVLSIMPFPSPGLCKLTLI